MKNTLAVVMLLTCAAAYAQKPPIKFGDIPMADMTMKVYAADTSAAAAVLCDFGTSSLEYSEHDGFQVIFERLRRVKILTKDGLAHAEFTIPLYHNNRGDEETISGLKVVTYNLENGKIVETKAKNDSFFKEKFDQNINFMKIAAVGVREGSIIEITYKVRSDFTFNFQDWAFQSTIPTRWSEYRAKIPEYYDYQKYMQGYVALTIAEQVPANGNIILRSTSPTSQNGRIDYRRDDYRWVAQDVPAFIEEPFTANTSDYISKINFELASIQIPGNSFEQVMGTWQGISTSFWERYNGEINALGMKDNVEAITAGAANDEEKAAKIFSYVRNAIEWDGTKTKYTSNGPRKTLEDKKGNSAEINILLACLLDKAGIRTKPVLISTRDNGFVRETIPVSSQLNYVICLATLGTKEVLLDATDRMLPFGVLPERCLNGSGLVIGKDDFKWVSLQTAVKSRTTFKAEVKLTEDGQITGVLKVDKIGYASARARTSYITRGEAEYLKDFTKKYQHWTISKSEFENTKDINQPFKEVHQVSVNEHATLGGDALYLNPFVIAREVENPFKLADRKYPVDFASPFEELYITQIVMPEGYKIEELPPSKVIALPEGAGRYVYNMNATGTTITLTSGLTINRSLFSQDQYPALREFYNQVIAKQAEQVVLKKK